MIENLFMRYDDHGSIFNWEGLEMLNKMTSMIFIILISTLFGYEQRGVDGEIICETIETNGTDYKFELKPVSGMTEWCTNVDWLIVSSAGTKVVETPNDICQDNDYVFKVCKDGTPRFNQTLIEITIYEKGEQYWEEIISFKIDYRDCRFRDLGYGSEDIAILVDGSDNKVYYAPGEGPADCTDEEEYTQISNNSTLNIWDVNSYTGSRDITCILPDPSLDSISVYNNHL
jgi:hypothetical protein